MNMFQDAADRIAKTTAEMRMNDLPQEAVLKVFEPFKSLSDETMVDGFIKHIGEERYQKIKGGAVEAHLYQAFAQRALDKLIKESHQAACDALAEHDPGGDEVDEAAWRLVVAGLIEEANS